MQLAFKILKKEPDGSFRSFEAATDMKSAMTRIEDLFVSRPGDYVVFAQDTDDIISRDRSSCRIDARRE